MTTDTPTRRKQPPQPADQAEGDTGWPDPRLIAWVAECRLRIRLAIEPEAAIRVRWEAVYRWREAMAESRLDGKLDLATAQRLIAASSRKPLSASILATISKKVAQARECKESCEIWASADKETGPCRLENAACRLRSRLRYLAERGWVPRYGSVLS